MTVSRRSFFRLEYPARHRPTLECSGGRFSVIEISEAGIRVHITDSKNHHFHIGLVLEATVQFSDGELLKIHASVLRFGEVDGEDHCVLRLIDSICTKRIFTEERFLLRIYPTITPNQCPEERLLP